MLGWLRNYFRRKMPYMDPEQAQSARAKLSLIYVVLGWNIIGLTVYWLFNENVPRTPINSVDYAKILGVRDATIIRYSGLKKVKEYDIHLKEEELEEFFTNPVTAEAEELGEKKTTVLE